MTRSILDVQNGIEIGKLIASLPKTHEAQEFRYDEHPEPCILLPKSLVPLYRQLLESIGGEHGDDSTPPTSPNDSVGYIGRMSFARGDNFARIAMGDAKTIAEVIEERPGLLVEAKAAVEQAAKDRWKPKPAEAIRS